MTPAAEKPVERHVFPLTGPWVGLGWFGILIGICYWPVLTRLISQWYFDEDMGHGFFVPILAGYIAWQKLGDFQAEPAKPNWLGLVLVVYSGLQLWVATLGAELFLARTAIVLSIIGVVLFLGGTKRLYIMAFPLFMLFFMIPIPALIYNQITFPLQLLASRVAEWTLMAIGIPVLREGNVLELAGEKLSVVDACSGIRSLLSLSFLSLVYGYFFEEKAWLRALLFVATIPFAMIANASRVTLTGIVADYRPELAHGVFHTAEGWVIFMVALAMLALFHQFVNIVFIERFMPGNNYARILTVVLVLQAALFYATSRAENVPSLKPLHGFAGHFPGWTAIKDGYVDDETNAILKADDTLIREYASPKFSAPAGLFVAFFKTQRTGKTPHSPKNCLPGSSWEASTSDYLSVSIPGVAEPILVNRYIVSKGDSKSVVLYWYQTQKRVVASEFKAKLLTVEDSISQNRTDTALVRVVVPVTGNGDAVAEAEAIDFVQVFFGPLRQYLPS